MSEPVTVAPPAADGSITHTVRPGQTCYSIAIAYFPNAQSGMAALDTLKELNPEYGNCSKIQPGDKLRIRRPDPSQTDPPVDAQPRNAIDPILADLGIDVSAPTGSGVVATPVLSSREQDELIHQYDFKQAVDISGTVVEGTTVCFPGTGLIVMLDDDDERTPVSLANSQDGGKTCAKVDEPGTVALLPANALHESIYDASRKLLDNVNLRQIVEDNLREHGLDAEHLLSHAVYYLFCHGVIHFIASPAHAISGGVTVIPTGAAALAFCFATSEILFEVAFGESITGNSLRFYHDTIRDTLDEITTVITDEPEFKMALSATTAAFTLGADFLGDLAEHNLQCVSSATSGDAQCLQACMGDATCRGQLALFCSAPITGGACTVAAVKGIVENPHITDAVKDTFDDVKYNLDCIFDPESEDNQCFDECVSVGSCARQLWNECQSGGVRECAAAIMKRIGDAWREGILGFRPVPEEPAQEPTITPTQAPRIEPTQTPTIEPTQTLRIEPTQTPTIPPTSTPTTVPDGEPQVLTDCQVTTETIMNLRDAPDGNTIRRTLVIPRGSSLAATERDGNWYKIEYGGITGWISAQPRHVNAQGFCGSS